jgi:hypothetical protein
MQPYAVRGEARAEAETLAEITPITAIAQTAPQEERRHHRCGEIDGEQVEKSQAVEFWSSA